MASNRTNRINQEVKKEISDIIRELKDPRIPMMTSVVSVEVTKDLRYAKVYVSIMGDEKQQKDAIEGLENAAGFIRKEIGHRVNLRYTPEIIFVADKSIQYGAHISKLLNEVLPSKEEGTQNDDATDN